MAEKKYWVKSNMKFNLDSMITHIWCMIYDMEDGVLPSKVEFLGETCDIDRLHELKDECGELLCKADYKVTGKDYGRIKFIADTRNMIRYATCLNNGMSEQQAGLAFFD